MAVVRAVQLFTVRANRAVFVPVLGAALQMYCCVNRRRRFGACFGRGASALTVYILRKPRRFCACACLRPGFKCSTTGSTAHFWCMFTARRFEFQCIVQTAPCLCLLAFTSAPRGFKCIAVAIVQTAPYWCLFTSRTTL